MSLAKLTFMTTSARMLLMGFFSLGLSSCATTGNSIDPLEGFNRQMFALNTTLDENIVKPVATVYKEITPEPVNQGITNFFNNLGDVLVIVNDVLQFKWQQAGSDSARLVINSTLGLAGFLDLATQFGYPKHYEDIGQTLGYWGVESGPYLVVPVWGPSSVRDFAGDVAGTYADPRSYVGGSESATRTLYYSTETVRLLDKRADIIGVDDMLDTASLDPYIYMRDAYLQRRQYLVHDGNPPQSEGKYEDLFEDLEASGVLSEDKKGQNRLQTTSKK